LLLYLPGDQRRLQTTGNIKTCCFSIYLEIKEDFRQQEILRPVAPLFTFRSKKTPDNRKYQALLLLFLSADQ
jgi:hypothetical protein